MNIRVNTAPDVLRSGVLALSKLKTTGIAVNALIGLHAAGMFATLVYDRTLADEAWRLLTASLVHYNTAHLVSNVFALLLLGSIAELGGFRRCAISLGVIVIAATGACVHLALTHYAGFAGISCVNYALLGFLCAALPAQRFGYRHFDTAVITLAVLGYQTLLMLGTDAAIRPVWELHLAAFSLGLLWALARNRLRHPGHR